MEEINVNGDSANHENEVSAVYSDCIQVQAECHKEWEKLRRLRQIEAEISGNFVQDQSLGM